MHTCSFLFFFFLFVRFLSGLKLLCVCVPCKRDVSRWWCECKETALQMNTFSISKQYCCMQVNIVFLFSFFLEHSQAPSWLHTNQTAQNGLKRLSHHIISESCQRFSVNWCNIQMAFCLPGLQTVMNSGVIQCVLSTWTEKYTTVTQNMNRKFNVRQSFPILIS